MSHEWISSFTRLTSKYFPSSLTESDVMGFSSSITYSDFSSKLYIRISFCAQVLTCTVSYPRQQRFTRPERKLDVVFRSLHNSFAQYWTLQPDYNLFYPESAWDFCQRALNRKEVQYLPKSWIQSPDSTTLPIANSRGIPCGSHSQSQPNRGYQACKQPSMTVTPGPGNHWKMRKESIHETWWMTHWTGNTKIQMHFNYLQPCLVHIIMKAK